MTKDRWTLRDFINSEMYRRQMSATQFADIVGVAPSTITRALDLSKDPPMPTLDFLAKLAKATNTDICTLVALVLPDSTIGPDARARMLGDRIRKLPEAAQRVIEGFIINAVFDDSQD